MHMFAFVMLDVIFLILRQEIGWEKISKLTYYVSGET